MSDAASFLPLQCKMAFVDVDTILLVTVYSILIDLSNWLNIIILNKRQHKNI